MRVPERRQWDLQLFILWLSDGTYGPASRRYAQRLRDSMGADHPRLDIQRQHLQPQLVPNRRPVHLRESYCPFSPLDRKLMDDSSDRFRSGHLGSCIRCSETQDILPGRCCVLRVVGSALDDVRQYGHLSVNKGNVADGLRSGAAMWSALIAKDSWLKIVHVEYGNELGIFTTAGASLCRPTLLTLKGHKLTEVVDLTWVAFVLVTLSVLPYVVACCTFRRD